MGDTLSAGSRLSSAAGLTLFGGLVGAVHGLTETALLRAAGLQLTWADATIAAVAFALAAAFGAAVVAAVLAFAPLSWAQEDGARRSLVLGGAALAYSSALARTLDGFAALALAVVGIVVAVGVISRVRSGGAGSALGAAVAISGVFCGLFFVGIEWSEGVAASRWPLAALAAVFAAATLAFLAVCVRARPHPGVAFAGWAALSLLWVQTAPTDRYPWRTSEKAPALGGQPPTSANLLLVVLDTVRADHMDLFGYERPTMPLLAARAGRDFDVVMKSAAVSPWTLPSHASMFTGLYAWKHGAHRPSVLDPDPPDSSYPLRPDARVMADVMADAGYRTANVAANFAILSGFGLTAGFEYADITPGDLFLYQRLSWLYRADLPGAPTLGYPVAYLSPSWLRRQSGGLSDRTPPARRAPDITAAASGWLDRNGSNPFFLFVNYLDAHAPYLPVPEDDERFVARPADPLPMSEIKQRFYAELTGGPKVGAEQLEFVEGQYDAELVGLDRGLESLFADLEQRGLYDDTLIIVTSDHGEAFQEHGIWGHETSVYESQISVPLLIKLPSSYQGPDVLADPSMQHVDLLPTIAEVLGVDPPAGLQGSPWGVGRGWALSEVYCYSCAGGVGESDVELFQRDLTGVVVQGRKAILSTRDPAEYYDLAADPNEQRPLDPPPAELAKKAAEVAGAREIYVSDSAGEADPQMVEKLKSLGYIQ